MDLSFLHAVPLLATLVSLSIGIYLFKWRLAIGGPALIILFFSSAQWSLGHFLELYSVGLDAKLFWDNLQFIGYSLLTPATLVFILHHTEHKSWISRRLLAALAVEPLLTNVLAWTNPLHGLVRLNPSLVVEGPVEILTYGWGLWMQISTAYVVLLFSLSILFVLGRIANTPPIVRRQTLFLLAGLLIPWVGGLFMITTQVDMAPVFFTLGFSVMAVGIIRHQLFQITPATYKTIVENVTNGIMVLSPEGKIVELNRSAEQMLEVSRSAALGAYPNELFPVLWQQVQHHDMNNDWEHEVTCEHAGRRKTLMVYSRPLHTGHSVTAGWVLVLHDITRRTESEEALRRSEERFSNLGKHLSEKVVFFAATQGNELVYISEGVEHLGQLSKEQALQCSINDIADWTQETIATHELYREKLLSATVDQASFVASYLHPSGATRYLMFYEYLVEYPDRQEPIIEGVAIDLTAEKEAESALRVMSLAIENTQASVVITNIDAEVTYINPFFEKVTGYSKDEIIGRNPKILQSGRQGAEFYTKMWATLVRGDTWRGELLNTRKNKELYWENAIISPVKNEQGAIINYIGIKDEITEQKRLQELKAEVDRISQHDIKSPLNGIINIPRLMRNDSNLTEEQKEYLDMITESGETVLGLLNLSLVFYQVEQGLYTYNEEDIDLAKLLEQCIFDCKGISGGKNLQVDVSTAGDIDITAVKVRGEMLLAYSVFSNLLKNAVEASPKEQQVQILVRPVGPDSTLGGGVACAQFECSIRNRGAVPEAVRESFFDKYTTSGKDGGTGIGTYSSKILSEAQGWQIAVNTAEEDATTVTLTIPSSLPDS